jgi:hypothetical protein
MTSRMQLTALLLGLLAVAGSGCKKNADTATTGAATTTAAPEVAISTVQLGKGIGSDKHVTSTTDKFSPRDTIYVSVVTSGNSPSSTITARWTYQDGQLVKEDSRTIASNGTDATEFHISKPSGWPKGKYKVTVTVGGSTKSEDFEVK